jgi:hypothetical protein
MSKRLKQIAKRSNLMNISIQYGNDKIKFNLFEELTIDEVKLNDEIKSQPSYYGFLSVLMVRLKKKLDDKLAIKERIFAELFTDFKDEIDSNTNRPFSNDVAEAMAIAEESYQQALKEHIKAEEEYGLIKACVDSFTQRSHLIQSLSANVRKEKQS